MTRLALPLLAALLCADLPAPTPASPPDDHALLQVAREVAQAHRQADALAEQGQAREAARRVERALALPFPTLEEAWPLRADLFARLSQLRLQAGEAAGAERAARDGVREAKGRPASIYAAQLWLRLGEALEAQGDDDGAVEAYQSAIDVAKDALAARRDDGRGP